MAKQQRKDQGRSVQLPPELDADLEAWCTDQNRVKRLTVAKIVRGFLDAHAALRSALLDEVPPEMRETYAQALEGLARQVRGEKPPPNGTRRIKRRKAVRTEDGEIEHQERRAP